MGREVTRFVDAELKNDSRLVQQVKNYRNLYDKNHKQFFDRNAQLDTWKVIAQKLGKSETECEKRWFCIINRFYDELLWMLKYESQSPWLLYPQLSFLGEHIDWDDINMLCQEFIEEFETDLAFAES